MGNDSSSGVNGSDSVKHEEFWNLALFLERGGGKHETEHGSCLTRSGTGASVAAETISVATSSNGRRGRRAWSTPSPSLNPHG